MSNLKADITVVIPTLGGDCLPKTIDYLNKSTVQPTEILVCMPEKESLDFTKIKHENVKLIVTPSRGQVSQRAFGFKKANTDIVMQLDDDIHVEKYCIENLVSLLLNNGSKVAVAPALFCTVNDKFPYINKSQSIISRLYHYILNGKLGYMPGTVTKAGTEIGVDPNELEEGYCEVEWLPGGCVMHFNTNLVCDDFYPFSGKAYCEDLLHSYHLKQKGIRMLVAGKALCNFESFNPLSLSLLPFLRNTFSDYCARKYYVELTSKSLARMRLYYIIVIIKYLLGRISTR